MKENVMEIFKNEEFGEIRTVVIDKEPWFVGKDIAEILGYSNPRKALIDHVDNEDKRQGDGVTIRDSIGRQQTPTVINESGLYSLILSSKLPNAKKFKHWVTSEVLPSIRKYGVYATEQLLNNPDFMIAMCNKLKEEKEARMKLEKVNNNLKIEVKSLKPKAEYLDVIQAGEKEMSVSVIAKEYGFSGNIFNLILNGLGIQYKTSGVWVLRQKYVNKGYTKIVTGFVPTKSGKDIVVTNTRWTSKGREFLYYILSELGFVSLQITNEYECDEILNDNNIKEHNGKLAKKFLEQSPMFRKKYNIKTEKIDYSKLVDDIIRKYENSDNSKKRRGRPRKTTMA